MKRILILAPYKNIFPPTNGGMLRCFYILKQLSIYFDVTLISYQDENEIRAIVRDNPHFSKLKFLQAPNYFDQIKSTFRRKYISFWYKIHANNLRFPLSSDFFNFYFFLEQYKPLERFDIVIVENISLIQLPSLLKRLSPQCKIYYDAHNVDSTIARVEWKKGKISESIYKNILQQESNLFRKFDKIWACSNADADQFSFLNAGKIRIDVIPNGAELKPYKLKSNIRKTKLLFCGSLDYAPNEEGLIWFLKEIWPFVIEKSADISLTVIGKGILSRGLKDILCLPNVHYRGEVEEVSSFYLEADIVIVPLLSGSGTRLKVLEAMAHSRPIVSTSKGAEGINYKKNIHLLVEDTPYLFAEGIHELLNNNDLYREISLNANSLIEAQYTWSEIGKTIQKSILNEY